MEADTHSDASSVAADDDISVASIDTDDTRSLTSDLSDIELLEDQELGNLADKLRSKVAIQDRSWRLRSYPKCFIGTYNIV
jgi:hypothetical protein